jgi:hypothetical protein
MKITIYADGLLYAIQYDKKAAIQIFQRQMYDVESEINLYANGKLKIHWSNKDRIGHSESGWNY